MYFNTGQTVLAARAPTGNGGMTDTVHRIKVLLKTIKTTYYAIIDHLMLMNSLKNTKRGLNFTRKILPSFEFIRVVPL